MYSVFKQQKKTSEAPFVKKIKEKKRILNEKQTNVTLLLLLKNTQTKTVPFYIYIYLYLCFIYISYMQRCGTQVFIVLRYLSGVEVMKIMNRNGS